MGFILPALGAGSAIAGLFGGHHRPDYARMIAEFRAQRPTGYLTPEDEAFAGRQQDRPATAAGRSGESARYDALNRMTAMGLQGSPALGRAFGRIQQTESAGREGAAGAAADTLFNLRHGREDQQWQNERDIFGAQLGLAQNEDRRNDLQRSTFFNSLNEFLPGFIDHFSGTGAASNGNQMSPADKASGIYG